MLSPRVPIAIHIKPLVSSGPINTYHWHRVLLPFSGKLSRCDPNKMAVICCCEEEESKDDDIGSHKSLLLLLPLLLLAPLRVRFALVGGEEHSLGIRRPFYHCQGSPNVTWVWRILLLVTKRARHSSVPSHCNGCTVHRW